MENSFISKIDLLAALTYADTLKRRDFLGCHVGKAHRILT